MPQTLYDTRSNNIEWILFSSLEIFYKLCTQQRYPIPLQKITSIKTSVPPQFSNSLHIIHLQTPLFNSPIPNREIIPILTIQIHNLITQSRFLHLLLEIVERGEEDVVVAVL